MGLTQWPAIRTGMRRDYFDTPAEELWSCITHLLAACVVVGGLVFACLTIPTGAKAKGGIILFASVMIFLYLSSGLYHLIRNPLTRFGFRLLDHISIYLLIAATYTPIMMILGKPLSWVILSLEWALAVIGVIWTFVSLGKMRVVRVLFYLVMGWLILPFLPFHKWLGDGLPASLFLWIFLGGIAYTGGVFFYLWRRLPYQHAIWHLFVMGGSLCHFTGIYLHLGFQKI